MNIFYLHEDPVKAAQYQHNSHCVKMPLEQMQMLCTAHRLLDGELYIGRTKVGHKVKRWFMPDDRENTLYKATHVNHPSNVWIRESLENYQWAYDHFIALCNEYTLRYGKIHKCERDLAEIVKAPPNNLTKISRTPLPQAMPDQYKHENPVVAYRTYYLAEKLGNAVYTNREVPSWVPESLQVTEKTVER